MLGRNSGTCFSSFFFCTRIVLPSGMPPRNAMVSSIGPFCVQTSSHSVRLASFGTTFQAVLGLTVNAPLDTVVGPAFLSSYGTMQPARNSGRSVNRMRVFMISNLVVERESHDAGILCIRFHRQLSIEVFVPFGCLASLDQGIAVVAPRFRRRVRQRRCNRVGVGGLLVIALAAAQTKDFSFVVAKHPVPSVLGMVLE